MEIFYCNYYWSYVYVDISHLREPQCIEMGPRYCSLQDLMNTNKWLEKVHTPSNKPHSVQVVVGDLIVYWSYHFAVKPV